MNHSGRWRVGALASAIALLGCVASLEAHAVALGRITVQSALGEALRAEIDISDLAPEEASSLRVGVAGADVFRAAGFEYSAAAAGLDVRLQQRQNGRPYLRLTSNRAITEPFVDLVLEARWASGRLTRDYTMLIDPPNLRAGSSAPPVASAPVLPREPVTTAVLPLRQDAPAPYTRPASRPMPPAPARPQTVRPPAAETAPGARQVTVRPGDNASKIAVRTKPATVSLDQMLAALLRGNPEAFVGGNINLIKSGAVVDIPDAQTASALSPAEARQSIVAQSRDFNTFRRKLADGVPATQLASADRQAGGKVQARVDDSAQAAASPDRLTLSKGAVQGLQSGTAADAAKNAGGPIPPLAPPAAASTTPGLPVAGVGASPASGGLPVVAAVPAGVAASAAEPAAGAASPTTVAAPALAASAPEALPAASAPAAAAPVAAAQPPALTAPPAAPAEAGFMAQILDNSLLLGGGLLLALLAGLGIARHRKNAAARHVDSSFLDSRLQPDSFFGASGGQRVDTTASNAARSSSLAYSPSQLDAAGDVDPVAEADVYLAYGRDQQAEEILKEAVRSQPGRLAIHSKLLEIYAKRRDNKAFEEAALPAYKLTSGQGPEWAYISQLGRELEPSNSLYQTAPGFSASQPGKRNSGLVPLSSTLPQALAGLAPAARPPLDLDLDLDLDFAESDTNSAPLSASAAAPAFSGLNNQPVSDFKVPSAFLALDLNLDDVPDDASRDNLSTLPPSRFDSMAIADRNTLDFTPEPFLPPRAAFVPASPVAHSGMLEFDLGSLSLDLGPADKAPVQAYTGQEKDPLEIKFLLAEEFRILGDSEGARSLADEVLAQARGPLKSKAQAFLNTLS